MNLLEIIETWEVSSIIQDNKMRAGINCSDNNARESLVRYMALASI
ncbi:MAG: hypothetical protein JXR70_16785 [Spirochaetales bacterium]|nr:hypothetical protein [Spirochaetales bacterium]